MPTTTYSAFGPDTEAAEVAEVFASNICGKTIIITGGNRSGIAFSTAEALVSNTWNLTLIVADLLAGRSQTQSIDCCQP